MQIHLHNTMSRRKEPLYTGRPDRATLDVCGGPKVYNDAHSGDARPATIFDVLAHPTLVLSLQRSRNA
ncbi:hypothetical protein WQ56_01730 [Luteimonas sp. FCS-9]|nr:hypothetical protein WQ56_01730 [Luteimonas sp. FCS-9]